MRNWEKVEVYIGDKTIVGILTESRNKIIFLRRFGRFSDVRKRKYFNAIAN